jgi:hypothetical protein
MTRIYRHAGTDVVWTAQEPTTTDPDGAHSLTSKAPQVALSILCREITDELTVATTALGATPSTREYRGLLAYVFYNRVERVARMYLNTSRRRGNYDIDNVIMLAHAMAHEVGHLLLPYGHSATGLMRAEWDAQDLRLAVRGQLKFTVQQAAVIRARLSNLPVPSILSPAFAESDRATTDR